MNILLEKKDRTAFVSFQRPPLNVLNLSMMGELRKVLEEVDGDSAMDFLVLRGDGDRAFSAGVDIKDHTREKVPEMLDVVHGVIRKLFTIRQITIAVVRGACLGGGWELASSCDLVLASEESIFATPEITVGCYPPVALARFPSLMGYHRAAETILTGRRYSAREAHAFGMVNRVVPTGELEQAMDTLLDELKRQSAAVLRIALRGLREISLGSLSEALKKSERIYIDELLKTEDVEEGVRAFLDKRKPQWSHR